MSKDKDNADIGVSSCINGAFDDLNGEPDESNKWSFSYSKSDDYVGLSVSVSTPPLLIDNNQQNLKSSLSADDITQLINWLFQVKTVILQQQKSSPESTKDNN